MFFIVCRPPVSSGSRCGRVVRGEQRLVGGLLRTDVRRVGIEEVTRPAVGVVGISHRSHGRLSRHGIGNWLSVRPNLATGRGAHGTIARSAPVRGRRGPMTPLASFLHKRHGTHRPVTFGVGEGRIGFVEEERVAATRGHGQRGQNAERKHHALHRRIPCWGDSTGTRDRRPARSGFAAAHPRAGGSFLGRYRPVEKSESNNSLQRLPQPHSARGPEITRAIEPKKFSQALCFYSCHPLHSAECEGRGPRLVALLCGFAAKQPS